MSRRQKPIVYVDCETGGLDEGHESFEFGFIRGDEELLIWLPFDPAKATQDALRKNKYYLRKQECEAKHLHDPADAAWKIARITTDCILAGDNVQFDAGKLKRLLAQNGLKEAWYYHLLDVPTFAGGVLGMTPPWTSQDAADILGVKQDENEKHTALSDARRSKRVHEAALRLVDREQRKVRVAGVLEKALASVSTLSDPAAIKHLAGEWSGRVEEAICPPLPAAKEWR